MSVSLSTYLPSYLPTHLFLALISGAARRGCVVGGPPGERCSVRVSHVCLPIYLAIHLPTYLYLSIYL